MIYWISQEESGSGVPRAHDATWRIAVYRGWMTIGLIVGQALIYRFW